MIIQNAPETIHHKDKLVICTVFPADTWCVSGQHKFPIVAFLLSPTITEHDDIRSKNEDMTEVWRNRTSAMANCVLYGVIIVMK